MKKLGVVKIITHQPFDEIGNALPGGLYDLAMGPVTRQDTCKTCFKGIHGCGGHMGYIELSLPVYNPFFIKVIYSLLRIFCLSCYKLQLEDRVKVITELQLRLVAAGYLIEAEELEFYKSETSNCDTMVKLENGPDVHPKVAEYYELLLREPVNHYNSTKNTESVRHSIVANVLVESQTKTCIHCQQVMKRVKFSYKRLVFGLSKGDVKHFFQEQGDSDEPIKSANLPILASECREYLRKIWELNSSFLKHLYPILNDAGASKFPTDSFFMDLVPVTPPNVRPVSFLFTQQFQVRFCLS